MNEKLPRSNSMAYVNARKQANGKYKLFWRGTNNEIFYGKTFTNAAEARMYYKVQHIKQYAN
jgi:hypothetical protein